VKYFYILSTILFTVYGQIVIKWQMSKLGTFPDSLTAKVIVLFLQFKNIWILSSFAAAFVAALCWMAAITKLELSIAYPFMGLTFLLVLFLSYFVFNEPLTLPKTAGCLLIIFGIIVSSR
jgi:multidrug transporter EmrE-like cation transporter